MLTKTGAALLGVALFAGAASAQETTIKLTLGSHHDGCKCGADKVEDGKDPQGPVDIDGIDQRRDHEPEDKTSNTGSTETDAHRQTTVLIVPQRGNGGCGNVEKRGTDSKHNTLGQVELPELGAPGGEEETKGGNDTACPKSDLVPEAVHGWSCDDGESELEATGEGTDKGDGRLSFTPGTVDVVVFGLEDAVNRDISDQSQNNLMTKGAERKNVLVSSIMNKTNVLPGIKAPDRQYAGC